VGEGDFQFITYKQADERMTNFGSGLVHLGLKPTDCIGVYSKNRVEWQIVAQGSMVQSVQAIALYDTLGEDAVEYIVTHSQLKAICCSKSVLNKVLAIIPKCPTIMFIVCFDPVPENVQSDVKLLELKDVEKLGENRVDDVPPSPKDLLTIMYTSGTTGTPKGVMLTHENMVAMTAGVKAIQSSMNLTIDDTVMSYLPLAHIFERLAESIAFSGGSRVGYYSGDPLKLMDDMKLLKPTILPGVPRVFDRIYDKVKGQVENSSWLKSLIFNQAYQLKHDARIAGVQTPWSDFIVFNKIKEALGGNVRVMVGGGAPVRPDVQEFLGDIFDCVFLQGYGLTEVCGAGHVQLTGDLSYGHVGSIVPCIEMKLESVSELNYFVTENPPRGEVLYRGPCVSQGYYKDPERTAEVFDKDGWFHSGDIGELLPNGTLKVIDRKKNIFKLSQGEYVASEFVEGKLSLSKLISQIYVYGDSYQSSCVGVAVVEPVSLINALKQNGFPDASAEQLETLISDNKVKQFVLKEITSVGEREKLKGYEQVKNIHLISKEFTALGLTTPTMKLMRGDMKKHFQNEINTMYQQLNQ
jgi:long-chain acyl-CoA synthetase